MFRAYVFFILGVYPPLPDWSSIDFKLLSQDVSLSIIYWDISYLNSFWTPGLPEGVLSNCHCPSYYSGSVLSVSSHFSRRTALTIFVILCMKLDIDKWWKVTELDFWKKSLVHPWSTERCVSYTIPGRRVITFTGEPLQRSFRFFAWS